MGKVSFKVVVAGRTYPLTINEGEEEKIQKAADDINVDGFKIGSGTGKFNDRGVEKDYNPNNGAKEIKAQGPSMQEALLKKISKYEELLK